MVNHVPDPMKPLWHLQLLIWAENEGKTGTLGVSVANIYPHWGSLRHFLRVIALLLYTLHTISTYADSCLGLKLKIVLILRIKVPPDGHTRWTFFAYYPHYTLNLYKVASEPSEIPRFGPKKPYLHEKFDTPNYSIC